MQGTPSGETRLCPVCDSEIPAAARVCEACRFDLRLFDGEHERSSDSDRWPSKSIDHLIATVGEGKEIPPEFFETIKSVGKAASVEVPAGARPPTPTGSSVSRSAGLLKFECPECGGEVSEAAQECSICGAEFSEETIVQFECPACRTPVSNDASSCPGCGIRFAPDAATVPGPASVGVSEKSSEPGVAPARPSLDLSPIEEETARPAPPGPESPPAPEVALRARVSALRDRGRPASVVRVTDNQSLYRELPRLVAAVKPLLLGAKRADVDIEEQRKLISEAIASGKSRDIERAVRLVGEAKHQLEGVFAKQLADRGEALVADLERAKAAGEDVASVRSSLDGALSLIEAGRYLEASDQLMLSRVEFEKRAVGYHRAQESLTAAEVLTEDAHEFGFDVREPARLLRLGRELFSKQEWNAVIGLAEQAGAELRNTLPGFLEDEMKRARNTLLDMKVRGVDLSRPVEILKEASSHLQRQEFAEAMRYVRKYRQAIEALRSGSNGR